MSVSASHILVKHKGSRRVASWKDPEGVEIKKRSIEDALKTLRSFEAELNAAPDLKKAFAELAKKNSDCSSAANGGDLGTFGRGEMQAPFEEATFGLKVGQMSGIVQTESGAHLILRTG
jgi:NIMA-interacting peptidyl-prolyl cis-trans isomerase 1